MLEAENNVKKYNYGEPVETYSVTENIGLCAAELPYFKQIKEETGYAFSYKFSENDRVYGLGEQVRGINKRRLDLGKLEYR